MLLRRKPPPPPTPTPKLLFVVFDNEPTTLCILNIIVLRGSAVTLGFVPDLDDSPNSPAQSGFQRAVQVAHLIKPALVHPVSPDRCRAPSPLLFHDNGRSPRIKSMIFDS